MKQAQERKLGGRFLCKEDMRPAGEEFSPTILTKPESELLHVLNDEKKKKQIVCEMKQAQERKPAGRFLCKEDMRPAGEDQSSTAPTKPESCLLHVLHNKKTGRWNHR